jgi:CRP-like cAMP-binding protein
VKGDTVNAETLRKIIYFSRLGDDEIKGIVSRSVEVSREGAECLGLYFVIEGMVKVSRISPEGREQVLSVMGPNQSFNDVPVFDGGRNPATVMALEPSVIGMVPKDLMLALVREHGLVAEAMLRVFASHLRSMTTLVADLTHLDVAGRVAKGADYVLCLFRAARASPWTARPGLYGRHYSRGGLPRPAQPGGTRLPAAQGGRCGDTIYPKA